MYISPIKILIVLLFSVKIFLCVREKQNGRDMQWFYVAFYVYAYIGQQQKQCQNSIFYHFFWKMVFWGNKTENDKLLLDLINMKIFDLFHI
jgi:hypothetical protein